MPREGNEILVVGGPAAARLRHRAWTARCAIGRAGIAANKREGDGATPLGAYPMRRILYRADRIARPISALPAAPLDPASGWCDDPASPDYNRPVRLPVEASAERLWRADALYDLIVVIGHNDAPVRFARGSAIFLHLAAPGYAPTEGCIALARRDLIRLLARIDRATRLRIARA